MRPARRAHRLAPSASRARRRHAARHGRGSSLQQASRGGGRLRRGQRWLRLQRQETQQLAHARVHQQRAVRVQRHRRSPASCLCRGLTRFWRCAARKACASCRCTRTGRWTSRCAPARRGTPVRPCVAAAPALCSPLFGFARATPLTARAPRLQPGHPYDIILHKVREPPGACAPPLRRLVAWQVWSGIKLQHRCARAACAAADGPARAACWRAAAVVVAAHTRLGSAAGCVQTRKPRSMRG